MPSPPALSALPEMFGQIDIYLFDQLLKGRFVQGMRVLDAGCGAGRNISYLLQAGIQVFGTDRSEEAIQQLKMKAAEIAPHLPSDNFTVSDLSNLSYPDAYFDAVICSAVLHFSEDEAHFTAMVLELWRVLKPGGMFFCRLSTTIGMEGKMRQVRMRHYHMPHGPIWFLADETLLRSTTNALGASWLEPLKTVLVEHDRSMTTWVLQKNLHSFSPE